jgi:hypothetical protein
MRIAYDVKDRTALCTRHPDALRNESAAYPISPLVGLDEQAIQFTVPVRPGQDRRKADDTAVQFRDHHLAGVYLLIGEGDRIGVCQQSRAVAGVVQGCARLQGF